jgi:hypothetical protein
MSLHSKEETMPHILFLLATMAVLTAVEPAFADSEAPWHPPSKTSQQSTVPETKIQTAPTAQLLGSIVAWLTENYDLPPTTELPQIEFDSPLKLASLRYKGLLPYAWREDSILNPAVPAAQQREVVAVYDDRTRTIHLPQGWTGETQAERSVLVHELVHHLQNVGGLRFECTGAREKLAYEAQSEWLKLHGLNLEEEFEVDMMTVLVRSGCMH